MISVLIPTLNEEGSIGECLQRVRCSLPRSQILVVDGGSTDRTLEIAARDAEIIRAPRGRGRQLNLAASHARGDTLLFLHADTLLPANGQEIEQKIASKLLDTRVVGGNFRVRFAPSTPAGRCLETGYRLLRAAGIFFGDSAIFVRKAPFLARGGFHRLDLMEDVELVQWMHRAGRVVEIDSVVTTSSRRFRNNVARHLLLWTMIHALYYCGVPDRVLVRLYSIAR